MTESLTNNEETSTRGRLVCSKADALAALAGLLVVMWPQPGAVRAEDTGARPVATTSKPDNAASRKEEVEMLRRLLQLTAPHPALEQKGAEPVPSGQAGVAPTAKEETSPQSAVRVVEVAG